MTEWIIPCNIKYYDVIGAFNKLNCIDWKQSNKNMVIGDIVFIYIGKPLSKICFKCKINKINLSNIEIDDNEFILDGTNYINYGNHMELELIQKYEDELTLSTLKNLGVKGNIQGPRKVNELLSDYINSLER